jgi:hypothetical protein
MAIWLGDVLNSASAGFALVGAFYFVLMLIVMLTRKGLIERPMMNAMLRREGATNKKTVHNIDDLRLEIDKFKTACAADEAQIKKDLEVLRNDLKPENMLLNIVSGITGIRFNRESTGKGGLFYGLSLLIQRLMLRAEKKAEDTVYGLVDVLFQRIQDFVRRHTSHDARRDERADEPKKDA